MKRKNRFITASIILMSMVMLSACSKPVDLSNTAAKKDIALILNINYGNHWSAIKQGANAAAKEFNVNIKYYAPTDEENINEQIQLVNDELDGKHDSKRADAIILAPSDYTALVDATEKAYNSEIPVIIVDTEVNTNKINSYIGTDNLEAGKMAGNEVVSAAGKNARVAIMSLNKGSHNAKQREDGLKSILSKYPNIKVVAEEYCMSDSKLSYNLTKKVIEENSGAVDAIVALNESASEGVAQAIDEMNLKGKVKVIAFDSTLQEINFLEKGVIQGMVIQNSFSMGYLSVKSAVEAMEGKKIQKSINTGCKLIDKDNMYLPENQKLLFPFRDRL